MNCLRFGERISGKGFGGESELLPNLIRVAIVVVGKLL